MYKVGYGKANLAHGYGKTSNDYEEMEGHWKEGKLHGYGKKTFKQT